MRETCTLNFRDDLEMSVTFSYSTQFTICQIFKASPVFTFSLPESVLIISFLFPPGAYYGELGGAYLPVRSS